MPLEIISALDLEDPRFFVFRGLRDSPSTRTTGKFVVEGRWLVQRLLESEFEVESILIDQRRLQLLPDIPEEIPVFAVDSGELDQLVGFDFHRGVLACGLRRPRISSADLLPTADGAALWVICVGVVDPANLGGIIRCASAFGVDCLLLDETCTDPFARRVLRVSMGTALRVPVARTHDVCGDLTALQRSHGFELNALVLDESAESLASVKRPHRLALLVGNEGYGLTPDTIACCDRRVTIPMQPHTDSLNAVVATGVALYHFTQLAIRVDSET